MNHRQADPVTPLVSGELVHKLLGNSSSLIVQDSPGVRSFLSLFSPRIRH